MSARTLTNVVNDQTVALNALIYGYAGHSLVTPQHALQQVWWTEERITDKVTPDFITSRLRPNEREKLERNVGFGDLTDHTYIEWILKKGRRLFLILAEIGEADSIFAVVEKSWDDDDLPLSIEDIEQLELSNRRGDGAAIRFYQIQFSFLLRVLREGVHIDYAPNEQIPLEYVMRLPPAVTLQNWSRVHLPQRPNEIYVRRKFALGNADAPNVHREQFMMDVETAKMVEHEHIAPVWASYTAKGFGYTFTNFVGQHTLKSFIDHRNPTQYQKLAKPERRYLVLNWLHCLADAVATLHQNGFCHAGIRPTNIIIDEENTIAFCDIASLETFARDKRPDPMDAYIYSAPEAQDTSTMAENNAAPPVTPTSTSRRPLSWGKNTSASSNTTATPRQKLAKPGTNDFSTFHFGFKRNKEPVRQQPRNNETEQADIFSLGCVFLEIVTFMLKKKSTDFTKYRSSKQRINMGGKNSRVDSSYHANMEKMEPWMEMLEGVAAAQEEDAFEAVSPILALIRSMLGRNPNMRPSAKDVRDRVVEILFNYTGIPYIHCGDHKHDWAISDRASSLASFRRRSSLSSATVSSVSTVSTMSMTSLASSDTDSLADSDRDTIRWSTSSATGDASSVFSYPAPSMLSGISEFAEDDNASICTERRARFREDDGASTYTMGRADSPPLSGMIFENPRIQAAPNTATPPATPPSTSSFILVEPMPEPKSSPSSLKQKIKPWSKPFALLP